MIFNNFIQTQEGLTITLKNYNAILNIKSIKFYKEEVTGSFSKKEFRWSYDPNSWSSWQSLTPVNFSNINPRGRSTTFFEFRYVLNALKSGKVNGFIINYEPGAINITESNIITSIPIPPKVAPTQTKREPTQEKPPEKVVPVTIISSPLIDVSTAEIPENLPKYSNQNEPVITSKTTSIVNADTLGLKSPDYYLWRPYHKGTQKIKTIQGLQGILNNLTNGLQNSIFRADNIIGDGIGVLYDQTSHELRFKRVSPGYGISISELTGGIIQFDIDASISNNDSSINELFDIIYILDSSIINLQNQISNIDTSSSIGDSLNSFDASISRIDASISRIDVSLNSYGASISSIDASISRIDAAANTGSITFEFYNGGSNLTVGIKDTPVILPYSGRVTRWEIMAYDASNALMNSSCVVDILSKPFAELPILGSDSIAGSYKPTLISASKNSDSSIIYSSLIANNYMQGEIESIDSSVIKLVVSLVTLKE